VRDKGNGGAEDGKAPGIGFGAMDRAPVIGFISAIIQSF
jgi:hypothetical protein